VLEMKCGAKGSKGVEMRTGLIMCVENRYPNMSSVRNGFKTLFAAMQQSRKR